MAADGAENDCESIEEKTEVDPADAWVKKVDKFRASLKKAIFSSFGDRRSKVEGALGLLLAVIKREMPAEVPILIKKTRS
jgi:hypothetical protein